MHLKRTFFILMLSSLMAACNQTDEQNTVALKNAAPSVEAPEDKPIANAPTATLIKKKYDPEVINFEGFGPAKFGDNEESVRMSWGRPLVAGKPAKGATCYYLYKEAIPKQNEGISFMLEDGKFVRYDVDDASIVAPGGIVVGDTAAEVLAAHTNHVTKAPHKYIQGAQTLTVNSNAHKNANLIFEVDTSGTIVNWRIGVVPQVYYVEGCG